MSSSRRSGSINRTKDNDSETEKVLGNFFSKAPQLILQNRKMFSKQEHANATPTPWFNCKLMELPSVKKQAAAWRKNYKTNVLWLDILLKKPLEKGQTSAESILLERWSIQYQDFLQPGTKVSFKQVYTRSIVMMRSLNSLLLLLPCYQQLVRKLLILQNSGYSVEYDMSNVCPAIKFQADYKAHNLVEIHTTKGSMTVGVQYLKNCKFDFLENLETQVDIVMDYNPEDTQTGQTKDTDSTGSNNNNKSNSNNTDEQGNGKATSSGIPIYPNTGGSSGNKNSNSNTGGELNTSGVGDYTSNSGHNMSGSAVSLGSTPPFSDWVMGSAGSDTFNPFTGNNSANDGITNPNNTSPFMGGHNWNPSSTDNMFTKVTSKSKSTVDALTKKNHSPPFRSTFIFMFTFLRVSHLPPHLPLSLLPPNHSLTFLAPQCNRSNTRGAQQVVTGRDQPRHLLP
eukprot:TRINITY_DN580_c0_g1_i1.p1 TRINITY_DN580_c0_g1~~TRINITY_DN580_c0_g1_i1.p1  ORF type:complete len:463 (+),score=81.20 TRINITY_DN580_c0_g1_i1:33-1391(+)